jgi:hypothetical protein
MRKADEVKMEWAIETGRRSDLERRTDAAMLHALFFWQLSERAANVRVKARWEARGNERMEAALRLMKELGSGTEKR